MIKIGDKFETEGYGQVKVVDIFISPTSQERCYEVVDSRGFHYLVWGSELIQ